MAVVGRARNASVAVYSSTRAPRVNLRVNGTTFYEVAPRSLTSAQTVVKVLNGVRSTLASIPASGGGTQDFVITAENNHITSNTGLDVYDSEIDVVGDWDIASGTLISFENLDTPTGFTVSYNANGGTGSIENQSGTTIILASSGFARSGYNLAGWNTQADGSGTSYALGQSVTLSANMTLYAVWELVVVKVRNLYAKGQQVTSLYHNGQEVNALYHNGVLVFEK